MTDKLEAASRLLIRASLAVFTVVVLLLIQSAFWSNRVSAWMQLVISATALLSYFRPHYVLLALAALVPLGQVGSRTLDSQMRGAEALVLAFLAGALMRGWTLREFRTFPSTRLHVAALIFGFVVAASCVEQIWFAQIQRDFAWPFAQDLLTYASRNYVTSRGGFDMVFRAMLLLEGVALLIYVNRYVRQRPELAPRLVEMLVIGCVSAAVVNIVYLWFQMIERGISESEFLRFITAQRWTVHVGDVNAAASFFAMGTFVALGLALTSGTRQSHWIAAGLITTFAFWMTGSRTAMVAVLLVGSVAGATMIFGRLRNTALTMVITLLVLAVVSVLVVRYYPSRFIGPIPVSRDINIRWELLGTTAQMLKRWPLFGVGVGQYSLWSPHFSSKELMDTVERAPDAHNNFAQVAGELGGIGFAAFLGVLAVPLWCRQRQIGEPYTGPALAAIAVFIVTWLGGHPLLVAEVAFPFWLILGVVSAPLAASASRTAAAWLVGITVAVLLFSIPFRVGAKSADIDMSRVNYGVSARQIMTSRARFFVPANVSRIQLPLRARNADDDDPIEIEVLVDGTTAEIIRLGDRDWQRPAVVLPDGSPDRFHQIDLQIRTDAVDSDDPDRRSVEVGKWEIIAKPNG